MKKCNCFKIVQHKIVQLEKGVPRIGYSKYSEDLKSDHLKSGNIWNPDFLKVRFQMVRFSNGQALAMAIALVPTIWTPDHLKSRLVRISNGKYKMATIIDGFQIVGFPD